MNLYERYLLPTLVHRTGSASNMKAQRAKVVPLAWGDAPFDVELVPAPAERSLREVARVLKPSGRLLFCEHGIAPDESVRRRQTRLDPVWRRVSGGCHLDRDVPALLERAGFTITEMDATYLPGLRLASFQYLGTAVPGPVAS